MARNTQQKKTVSNDGYSDAVKNIGIKKKRVSVNAEPTNAVELSNAFRYDGVAKNIVKSPADDSVSAYFEIDGDADGSTIRALNKAGFRQALKKSAIWSRLFGGAILVYKVKDGRSVEEPIGKGEIVGFNVFSSAAVAITSGDMCIDKADPNYGEPDFYRVNVAGENVRIHHSRCVRFCGELLPDDTNTMSSATINEKVFGVPVLEGVFGRLKRMGMSEEGIAELMSELNIPLMKWKGLANTVSGKDGREKVRHRMEVVAESKSMNRAILIDAEDDFVNVKTDLGGAPETMYRQMQMLAAACGFTMAKLFGESNSGLSNTGKGNQTIYDNTVNSWREDVLTEPVCQVVAEFSMRNMSRSYSDISWNSITKVNDEEFVTMAKIQSDMFHTLIQDGVFTPDEVKEMAYKNGHTFRINAKNDSPMED